MIVGAVMKEESEAEQVANLKNTFSQNLLLFRKKFNYSQKDLAGKLNTSNKNYCSIQI